MMPTTAEIMGATRDRDIAAAFPHAPFDWSPSQAEALAKAEGLALTDDDWTVIRSLQSYFARHEDQPVVNMRELHDALDEQFHLAGGIRMLYRLFPGGPVAQGCRLAGLKAPYLATDPSFGSVS